MGGSDQERGDYSMLSMSFSLSALRLLTDIGYRDHERSGQRVVLQVYNGFSVISYRIRSERQSRLPYVPGAVQPVVHMIVLTPGLLLLDRALRGTQSLFAHPATSLQERVEDTNLAQYHSTTETR